MKTMIPALALCIAGCAGTSAEVMLGTQVRDGGFDPGHGVTATFHTFKREGVTP